MEYWKVFLHDHQGDTYKIFREKNRRMVLMKEELDLRRIRVFKWNQKLLPPSPINQEEEGRCWIFLLQINNRFITKIPGHNKNEERIRENRYCTYTNPRYSASSRRNREVTFRAAYRKMMHKCFPEVPQGLVSRIIDYVSFNFRFDAQTLLRPNGPMIVFVVEVDRTWTVEYDQLDLEICPVVDPSNRFPPDYLSAQSSDLLRRNGTPSLKALNDEEIIWIILLVRLKVKPIFPTIKLAEDEPCGLVQVEPQPALLKVHVCDLTSACPICLQGFSDGKDLMQTLCSHMFHGECISKWLSQAESCPVCRFGTLAPLPSWSPPICNDISLSCCCGETIIPKRIGNGQIVQYKCGCCGETINVKRTRNGKIMQYKCPCGESRKIFLMQRTGNAKYIQYTCPCGEGLRIHRSEEGFLLLDRKHGAPSVGE